jgi:hypothetical protein
MLQYVAHQTVPDIWQEGSALIVRAIKVRKIEALFAKMFPSLPFLPIFPSLGFSTALSYQTPLTYNPPLRS